MVFAKNNDLWKLRKSSQCNRKGKILLDWISKEDLINEYLTTSGTHIAKKYGVNDSTVYYALKKFGIFRRNRGSLKSNAGCKNPMFGRSHNSETKDKIRNAVKLRVKNGWISPLKGKVRSVDERNKIRLAIKLAMNAKVRKKISDSRIGRKFPNLSLSKKRLYKDPEWVKRWSEKINASPNIPERNLINLFEKYNLPLKYVGDFSLWIDGKNPDFISSDSRLIVEYHGVFHNQTKFNVPYHRTKQGTIDFYEKRGYKIHVVEEGYNVNELIMELNKLLEMSVDMKQQEVVV
jgi:hypothetical protein